MFLFSARGRIGRLEWWVVQLCICALYFSFIGLLLAGTDLPWGDHYRARELHNAGVSIFAMILFGFTCTLLTWIDLAMTAKRFHDRDKSGWWVLMFLVPIIGPIWLLIECGFFSGTAGTNSYGHDEGFFGMEPDTSTDINEIGMSRVSRRMTDYYYQDTKAPVSSEPVKPDVAPASNKKVKPVFGKRRYKVVPYNT